MPPDLDLDLDFEHASPAPFEYLIVGPRNRSNSVIGTSL